MVALSNSNFPTQGRPEGTCKLTTSLINQWAEILSHKWGGQRDSQGNVSVAGTEFTFFCAHLWQLGSESPQWTVYWWPWRILGPHVFSRGLHGVALLFLQVLTSGLAGTLDLLDWVHLSHASNIRECFLGLEGQTRTAKCHCGVSWHFLAFDSELRRHAT